MGVSKTRNICICILAIFLIFSPIVVFNYSNNEKIEKEIKENKLKTLEQEGETYRLITSADNVQVPVPKGYVASNITGENYVTPEYQRSTITHKGNYTELTWSSPAGEQYPWTQDENGIWISGNQGIQGSTSTLESEEFDYIKGTALTINYSFPSQSWDNLIIYLIDLTYNSRIIMVNNNYGDPSPSFDSTTSTYTYTKNDWETGRYKIKVVFRKYEQNLNNAYIKPSTYFKEDENGTQTIEEDIKTKIHDGGFVIYQLTDEEIETDPNGTSININDTNKDEAQNTRNQYVWVPVSNIEDIVRTKTQNNGIMQFGQNYIFFEEPITKYDSSFEPILLSAIDKEKSILQCYSDIKNRENFLNNMQEDYSRMIESINKYKGYYIGRYETGDETSHSFGTKGFKNPKVARNRYGLRFVTWYDSYKDLQRLSRKTGKYVETGMLYDSLWDYTLKWFNDTDTRSFEDIAVDSGTWGNYDNNEKDSSMPANTGMIDKIIYNGVTYRDFPTASNNIFDMAGNVDEWTRSRYNDYNRRLRGGYYDVYSTEYPASYIDYCSPSYSGEYTGARAQLYIL